LSRLRDLHVRPPDPLDHVLLTIGPLERFRPFYHLGGGDTKVLAVSITGLSVPFVYGYEESREANGCRAKSQLSSVQREA
jgi:hypothetical protein